MTSPLTLTDPECEYEHVTTCVRVLALYVIDRRRVQAVWHKLGHRVNAGEVQRNRHELCSYCLVYRKVSEGVHYTTDGIRSTGGERRAVNNHACALIFIVAFQRIDDDVRATRLCKVAQTARETC